MEGKLGQTIKGLLSTQNVAGFMSSFLRNLLGALLVRGLNDGLIKSDQLMCKFKFV